MLDKNNWFKKLKFNLESVEGKNKLNDYFNVIIQTRAIRDSQLKRFKEKVDLDSALFSSFVEKVIAKYNSIEYQDREYNLGREPKCSLFSFLFSYAQKYGRHASDDEYERYGGIFTSGIYYIDGYYFHLIQGQGSMILVHSKEA